METAAASMNPVWIALIVAIPAMLSPVLMAWMTNRNRRQEKQEDYTRQDQVAATAAESARRLDDNQAKAQEALRIVAAKAEETARLLKENNKAQADAAVVTQGQLKQIHTLVNSNMTAAMQGQYDATERELTMMLEVIALKKAAGHEPNIETLALVEATKGKISQLSAAITDRATQAAIVANEQKPEQK
jgi:ABC-type multidrug transport system fused ATPase/permease subunit